MKYMDHSNQFRTTNRALKCMAKYVCGAGIFNAIALYSLLYTVSSRHVTKLPVVDVLLFTVNFNDFEI